MEPQAVVQWFQANKVRKQSIHLRLPFLETVGKILCIPPGTSSLKGASPRKTQAFVFGSMYYNWMTSSHFSSTKRDTHSSQKSICWVWHASIQDTMCCIKQQKDSEQWIFYHCGMTDHNLHCKKKAWQKKSTKQVLLSLALWRRHRNACMPLQWQKSGSTSRHKSNPFNGKRANWCQRLQWHETDTYNRVSGWNRSSLSRKNKIKLLQWGNQHSVEANTRIVEKMMNKEQRNSHLLLLPEIFCWFSAYEHHVLQGINQRTANPRLVWDGSTKMEATDQVMNKSMGI